MFIIQLWTVLDSYSSVFQTQGTGTQQGTLCCPGLAPEPEPSERATEQGSAASEWTHPELDKNTASDTDRDHFDDREDSTMVIYNTSNQESDSRDNKDTVGIKRENMKREVRHQSVPTSRGLSRVYSGVSTRVPRAGKKTTTLQWVTIASLGKKWYYKTGGVRASWLAC